MTPEKIAELRALCEKATPGPWEKAVAYNCHVRRVYQGREEVSASLMDCDAAFIAAARTALPEALDEIDQLHILLNNATRLADEAGEMRRCVRETAMASERGNIAHWLERASGIESGCECDCDCDRDGHGVDCEPCWPCRFQECINKIRSGEASK